MGITIYTQRNNCLLLLVSMMAFCFISCGERTQVNEESDKKANVIMLLPIEDTDWSVITPVDLIDTLAKCGGTAVFVIHGDGPPAEWFDSTYIPLLTARLNDTTPSAIIFSVYENNSHTPADISTVRCQVQHLLDSYEKRRYPVYLCSYHGVKCEE